MPRRPRDDLQPIIRIKKTSEQKEMIARASEVDGSEHYYLVALPIKWEFEEEDLYLTLNHHVLNTFIQWATELRLRDSSYDAFNCNVFFGLISLLEISKVRK